MKTTSRLAPFAFFLAALCPAHAADWLHYRGPQQNGTAENLAAFPIGGPRELWRAQVGVGLSSVTVAGARAYTAGYREGQEVVVCLDVATGKEVWNHGWPAKLGDNMFEGGPRTTPTLDGGTLYMLGNEGHFACLDAATGKPVWEKDLAREFGAKRPEWGFSGSPTIDGNAVLIDIGGSGGSTLALNKSTGATLWKSGDDNAGYSSPVVATIGGQRTVVVLKAEALVGLDARSGRELWRSPWKTSYDVNAATPLVTPGGILISSGYNHGASLIQVSGSQAKSVWFNKNLRAHFNTPVIHGGHAFGIDGNADPRSPLVCIDVATGEQKWKTKSVQGGSLVLAGDRLLILTETGELVLAAATPGEYKELARQKVLSDRCWVQPTLANSRVFCRNNRGEVVAVSVAAK
jgi:outer membrane protein assembly factor BamB